MFEVNQMISGKLIQLCNRWIYKGDRRIPMCISFIDGNEDEYTFTSTQLLFFFELYTSGQ